MSILSFVRFGNRTAQSHGRLALRRRSALALACSEPLEPRQLLSVTLVSANVDNTATASSASDNLFGPFTSSDGRFVAFDSSADNIVPGVSGQQVYLRDRASGKTAVVSLDSRGKPVATQAWVAGMTPDANQILFYSADDLVPGDTNKKPDLYLYNVSTQTTTLVSTGNGGAASIAMNGSDPAYPAFISQDGRFVSFVSATDDLANAADEKATPTAATDKNAANDIFVRDLAQNRTLLVSAVSAAGTAGTAADPGTLESYAMSTVGSPMVVFSTDSPVDPKADTNASPDVYLRDVLGGVTTGVSLNAGAYVGGTSNVAISASGNQLAYLDNGDLFTSSTANINLQNPPNAGKTPAAFGLPYITPDGSFIFFRTAQTDIINNITLDGANVLRWDLPNNSLEVASFKSAGGTSTTAPVTLSASDDGRYVVFQSDGTGLDPAISSYGNPGQVNVYVRDMNAPHASLLSVDHLNPTNAADDDSWAPLISSDGTTVVFPSAATNLVPQPDANLNGTDIFCSDVPFIPTPPIEAFVTASNVTAGGSTSYTFSVTYHDSRGIINQSLASGNISVERLDSNGQVLNTLNPVLVSVSSPTDDTVLTAVYRISPPGGTWDSTDNDIYRFVLSRNSVRDLSNYPLKPTDLKNSAGLNPPAPTFFVNIPIAASNGAELDVTAPESKGSYTFKVARSDAGSSPASVTYQFLAATAIQGQDFSLSGPTTGTLTFAANGAPQSLPTITFLSDNLADGPETVQILLTSPTFGATFSFLAEGQSYAAGQPDYMKANLTIDDNSSVPVTVGGGSLLPSNPVSTVNDGNSSLSANESASVVHVPVSLPSITFSSGQTVSIPYTVYATGSDTAQNGVNFVAKSGTLVFNTSTGSSQNLDVSVLDDHALTGDRTFTVSFGNSVAGDYAVLGSSTQVTLHEMDSALSFQSASSSATDDSGVVSIPLTRSGNLDPKSIATLNFGGTAVAGVDYVLLARPNVDPTTNTVTFSPGSAVQNVDLQLLHRPLSLLGQVRTLTLSLSSPAAIDSNNSANTTYTSILGANPSTTLSITNTDQGAPQVSSFNLVLKKGRISAFTLSFSKNMSNASSLKNYVLYTRNSAGKLGQTVRLASAKYNSSTQTVTLTPASPLASNQFYQLNVNGNATLTDTAGNRLDGNNDGVAGGNFSRFFATGTNLTYADLDADTVNFRLKGPGTLQLVSSLNASDITLDVLNPDPSTSVLSASVKKAKKGNGTASLSLIRLHGASFNQPSSISASIVP